VHPLSVSVKDGWRGGVHPLSVSVKDGGGGGGDPLSGSVKGDGCVYASSVRIMCAPSLRICQGGGGCTPPSGSGGGYTLCQDLSRLCMVGAPYVRNLGNSDSFSRRLGSLDLNFTFSRLFWILEYF
jgi:hypothetical protein